MPLLGSTQKEILIRHEITFTNCNNSDDIRLPIGVNIEFESPVDIRRGFYNIKRVGAFSYFGGGDSTYHSVGSIGRFCSIAANCHIGTPDHPINYITSHGLIRMHSWLDKWPKATSSLKNQSLQSVVDCRQHWIDRQNNEQRYQPVEIGNDVWIGEGVFISPGVKIGDGAVIAARSVVTKDVEAYSIVGGVPAKIIKYRFDKDIISKLLSLKWWDYGLTAIQGANFIDISDTIETIENNISKGIASCFEPDVILLDSKLNIQKK